MIVCLPWASHTSAGSSKAAKAHPRCTKPTEFKPPISLRDQCTGMLLFDGASKRRFSARPPGAICHTWSSSSRASGGLTQAVVARRARVCIRFLSELENGKPTARLDKVLAVVRALGVAIAFFPTR